MLNERRTGPLGHGIRFAYKVGWFEDARKLVLRGQRLERNKHCKM
jgi:hypothetical protein